MNKGVIIGVLLLVVIIIGVVVSREDSTLLVNIHEVTQASKVIISQLQDEAKEAIPSDLQSGVDSMGLESTVRGELLSILNQDVISSTSLTSVGSSLYGKLLGTTEGDVVEPLPGTAEYNAITFDRIKELSGIGSQAFNIQALPTVDEESLMAMMVYSTSRGLPRQAKVHAAIIAYKRILAIGQTIELDLEEFAPDAGLMAPENLPLVSIEVDKLNEFLAAFLFPPDPPLNFPVMIEIIRTTIEQKENNATPEELEATLLAQEEATRLERENAIPGSALYIQVSNETMRAMVDKEFPLGDPGSLPQLETTVLTSLLEYAKSRSENSRYELNQSILFAKTITYKRVFEIGQSVGLNLKPYAPSLSTFTIDSVDFSEVDVETRNLFLEAFEDTYGITTEFRNQLVIDEIKRSISNDQEHLDPGSDEYRANTMEHVNSILTENGVSEMNELSEDILLQLEEYVISRGDDVLEEQVVDALEYRRLVNVGIDIGVDFTTILIWNVNLEELTVAQMLKLETVLKNRRENTQRVIQFLTDLSTVKDRKSQEAAVAEQLEAEDLIQSQLDAQAQAQLEAEEQSQIQAEQAAEEPQPTVEQAAEEPQPAVEQVAEEPQPAVEQVAEEPVQQDPELTEVINNYRSDKTGLVDVSVRSNPNGSIFVDLTVPSDITPSDSDKVSIFFTEDSWGTIRSYRSIFDKINTSKTLEGLTPTEIDTISSSGVIFDNVVQTYVRAMTVNINDRVENLSG